MNPAIGEEPQTNALAPELSPQTVTLVRKSAAPFSAGGSLELQLSNSPAGVQLVMTFDLEGLTPGTYLVEGARRAEGIPGALGQVVIRDPDATPDLEAGESLKEDSTAHQSQGVKSHIRMVIPLSRETGDIRYIRVTDRGGTVFLEGRLKKRRRPS